MQCQGSSPDQPYAKRASCPGPLVSILVLDGVSLHCQPSPTKSLPFCKLPLDPDVLLLVSIFLPAAPSSSWCRMGNPSPDIYRPNKQKSLLLKSGLLVVEMVHCPRTLLSLGLMQAERGLGLWWVITFFRLLRGTIIFLQAQA